MKKVLVTGSNGFVGKNLCAVLRRREDAELYEYDLDKKQEELDTALQQVDFVIHLAGVNRPEDPREFETGNSNYNGGRGYESALLWYKRPVGFRPG